MNDIIASVGFHYDQTEYNNFNKIYWQLTQKKSYVKFQLITLAMLIIPGLYFGICYLLMYKSLIRNSAKVVFKDKKDGFFESLDFCEDGLSVKLETSEFKRPYSDFLVIVKYKDYIAMFMKDNSLGYCIPTKQINNTETFNKFVSSLPNYGVLK